MRGKKGGGVGVRRVAAAMLICAACADVDDRGGFAALTLGDEADEAGGGTSDGGSTSAASGTKTGGDPPASDDGSTGEPGFDVDAEMTTGVDDGSTGAFDDTTGGGDDGGSTGVGAESDGGEPPPVTGAAMYAPCDQGRECADGVCLKLVQGDVEIGSYCTAVCADPALDCDPSGNATEEVCLAVDPHVLCGLECTGGLACPGAMSCFSFPTGDYCF